MSDKIFEEDFDMNRSFAETYFKVLADPKIDQEIKWFCILELLHDESVSLRKAHELCVEYGLLKNSYLELHYSLGNIWNKYYETK